MLIITRLEFMSSYANAFTHLEKLILLLKMEIV